MKRSPKRRLNGKKLHRANLYIDPEVFEQFKEIAGMASHSVTFEEMVRYISRKRAKQSEKVHFHNDSSL